MNVQRMSTPTALMKWARACRWFAGILAIAVIYLLIGSAGRMLWEWASATQSESEMPNTMGLLNVAGRRILLPISLGMMYPLLLAWSVAQYLEYMAGRDVAPQFFGRHLDKVLLLPLVGTLLMMLWSLGFHLTHPSTQVSVPGMIGQVLVGAAQMLFYYGLSELVRRSRPFVDEAKSLV